MPSYNSMTNYLTRPKLGRVLDSSKTISCNYAEVDPYVDWTKMPPFPHMKVCYVIVA